MTFEENPFRVLQVSIYDPKATIIERADDLSFAEPDDEKFFVQARDILLNPRKRIAAEVLEMVDDEIFGDMRKVEAVVKIDSLYSALDAEKIREQINAARAKAKFPAVQDTGAIKSELKNFRYEIREKIQARLKKMTQGERANFADALADYWFSKKRASGFGVVAEDFFECYRLEMKPFLDETRGKIFELCEFKFAFKAEFSQFLYEMEPNLKFFVDAMRPLEKFSAALGTNNFDATEEIFYSVRAVAIKHSRKPKEWTALNAKAAVIYLHMGTAMTWVNFHPKTALELFRKALPYAQNSGDAKLISLARQRVDEWQKIDRQLYANSSSSGCFSVIAGAAIIFLLTRVIF